MCSQWLERWDDGSVTEKKSQWPRQEEKKAHCKRKKGQDRNAMNNKNRKWNQNRDWQKSTTTFNTAHYLQHKPKF